MVKVGVSLTTHGSQNGYIQDSAQSGAFGVADAALGGEKANQAIFDFGKVKFGYCNPYPPWILLSYWGGLFSGAMLVSGSVTYSANG